MVDQYTHFDWAPKCDAIACIRYWDPDQLDPRQTLHSTADSSGISGLNVGAVAHADSPEIASDPENSSVFDSRRLHKLSSENAASVEGGSRTESTGAAGEGDPPPRRTARRKGTAARLLDECVELATGRKRARNPEAEVRSRLARVAKVLPQTAAPRRKAVAS